MKPYIQTILLVFIFSATAYGQASTFQDPLLDHMTGQWVLAGTIDGQETTHDVTIEWILGHQYIQIQEISREKKANGDAEYEALVFIGQDTKTGGYACQWLDVTGGGGLNPDAFGHALRVGDEIPFLFKAANGSVFRTRLIYQSNTDSWQWQMDGEENGAMKPFARVKLTRK